MTAMEWNIKTEDMLQQSFLLIGPIDLPLPSTPQTALPRLSLKREAIPFISEELAVTQRSSALAGRSFAAGRNAEAGAHARRGGAV